MPTRNLWSEVGLVNGISGNVVEIVWAQGDKAPALPDFVVLRLEGYTGPVWSSDPHYQGCVPIAPFEMSWSTTGDNSSHETRHQVPLALCSSITMHKSQGQTMDKAIIDLGKSESTAGLTFVCFSRAKHLVDLLMKPMPFGRLFQTRRQTYLSALATRRSAPSSSRWGDTTPPRGCSVTSVHIYVSLVRRRVEAPTPHYTNTCVKLTIVTHLLLSFSGRLAIANLS